MNRNLRKTAIILLTSLGFLLGIALGKFQDTYAHSSHHHASSFFHASHHAHSPAMDNAGAWSIQERMQERVAEKLRRAKEMEISAMEKAMKAKEMKFRRRCQ